MFHLWYQTSRSRVGSPASYSGSPALKSRPRDCQCWQSFHTFLHSSHSNAEMYKPITAALPVLSYWLLTLHPTGWIFTCACATVIVVQNKQNALRYAEMETVLMPIPVAIHLGVTDSNSSRAWIIVLVHMFCVIMLQSFWCAETPRKVSCCMSRD
jgi:hypothetical protein